MYLQELSAIGSSLVAFTDRQARGSLLTVSRHVPGRPEENREKFQSA
jgi:hypothetical protein